jgi:predicted DNA-binding antitoxin AbrB/MazE fold protein
VEHDVLKNYGVLEKVDILEGSKLKIVVEDFSEIDRIHEDIKKITGEISKEKILEVLDEAWI